jgi:4-hydroxymandelate oxidase
MEKPVDKAECRREFLKLLAGSPLLALNGLPRGPWDSLFPLPQDASAAMAAAYNAASSGEGNPHVVTSPEQARSVFDFEETSKFKIPLSHYQYLEQGGMISTNRAGFGKFRIRDRRMVDVSKIDMSVTLLGTKWETPIFLCPCGSQKAFHPEGEAAVARAAGAKGHLQFLSSATTTSIEDVIAAHGGSGVYDQLYATNDFNVTRALLKRAQAAGAPAVALTVDNAGEASNTESPEGGYNNRGGDTRTCSNCHSTVKFSSDGSAFSAWATRKPMWDGIDVSKVRGMTPLAMSWDLVKRIQDATTMKLFIKGIATREDAQLAVEHGVHGVYVSNHGGRSAPGSRATIDILPEVVDAVGGKIPVLIDSGFRHGEDVFKALALGATAVGIGRPYIWGLGSFGQPGVEAVLTMLRRELNAAMQQAGTPSIEKITRDSVIKVA